MLQVLLKAMYDSDIHMQEFIKDVCAKDKRLDERVIVDLLTTRLVALTPPVLCCQD